MSADGRCSTAAMGFRLRQGAAERAKTAISAMSVIMNRA
jgi:hypothetical protein